MGIFRMKLEKFKKRKLQSKKMTVKNLQSFFLQSDISINFETISLNSF